VDCETVRQLGPRHGPETWNSARGGTVAQLESQTGTWGAETRAGSRTM
jgi:hypothetical protein